MFVSYYADIEEPAIEIGSLEQSNYTKGELKARANQARIMILEREMDLENKTRDLKLAVKVAHGENSLRNTYRLWDSAIAFYQSKRLRYLAWENCADIYKLYAQKLKKSALDKGNSAEAKQLERYYDRLDLLALDMRTAADLAEIDADIATAERDARKVIMLHGKDWDKINRAIEGVDAAMKPYKDFVADVKKAVKTGAQVVQKAADPDYLKWIAIILAIWFGGPVIAKALG